MKVIKLTKGYEALVDDCDYKYLSKFSWRVHISKYTQYAKRSSKSIYMHREILKLGKSAEVDHINHNGLDNRRSNLRISDKSTNAANRKNTLCQYKGVSFQSGRSKPYRVRIKINQKSIELGSFVDLKEAVQAYNKAALLAFGSFARINVI